MIYAMIQDVVNDKSVVAFVIGANNEAIVHGENGLPAMVGNMNQLESHVVTI